LPATTATAAVPTTATATAKLRERESPGPLAAAAEYVGLAVRIVGNAKEATATTTKSTATAAAASATAKHATFRRIAVGMVSDIEHQVVHLVRAEQPRVAVRLVFLLRDSSLHNKGQGTCQHCALHME
jgi:hypothetical protein